MTRRCRDLDSGFFRRHVHGRSGIALLIRSQQRMQLLEGSIIVRNVPRQAKRVLDAAGIGRLISIQ